MPKELHEIKGFMTGTVITPSLRDIPEDAAGYSLNLDSVTEDGKLKSIPDDAILKSDGFGGTGSNLAIKADKMSMINNKGKRDIVYYDKDDSTKIKTVVDLYGTPSVSSGETVSSSSSEIAMQVHNKEVHVGTGYSATDKPKWVGYVTHKQFGSTISGIQVEDAELVQPGGAASEIYNPIHDGSHIYGSYIWGNTLYKIDPANGDVLKTKLFTKICGVVNKDSSSIYLLDKTSESSYGDYVINIVNKSDLTVDQSNTITTSATVFNMPSGFEISDIIVTTGTNAKMWYAAYKDGRGSYTGNMLFNSSLPPSNSSNAISDLTNRTPKLSAFGNTQAGSWVTVKNQAPAIPNWVDTAMSTSITETFSQSLVVINNNNVGWVCRFTPSNPTITSTHPDASSGDPYAWQYVYKAITNDAVSPYNGSGSSNASDYLEVSMAVVQIPYDYDSSSDKYFLWVIDGSTDLVGGLPRMGGVSQVPGKYDYEIDGIINDHINDPTDGVYMSMREDAEPIIRRKSAAITLKNTPSSTDDGATMLNPSTSSHNPTISSSLPISIAYNGTNKIFFMNARSGSFALGSVNDSLASSSESKINTPIRLVITDNGGSGLEASKRYYYKISYLYDGHQESPLSMSSFVSNNQALGDYSYSDENKKIVIEIDASALAQRVSHVNLYRAESDTASTSPTSFFRLIKTIDLDSTWSGTTERSKTIYDTGTSGASYEARTGISETLSSTIIHYAISTQINSYHIVGKCHHDDLDDGEQYLFKSRPFAFDQFNYIEDFLKLPNAPTALAAFQGRIYAFDENNTYRINPDSFYIEDTFEGVGCIGPSAVAVTEYGMCFCDDNNIYLHDGRNPEPIGEPIVRHNEAVSIDRSWQTGRTKTIMPVVVFDALRNSFLVIFKRGTEELAWAYNIARKRWDLWTAPNAWKSAISGKDGDVLVSVSESGGMLKHYLGGSGNQTWVYHTKIITLGQDTHNKMLYKIQVAGDPINITYYLNEGSAVSSGVKTEVDIPSADRKTKSIRVAMTSSSSTDEVDALGLIYRRLPVK